MSMSWLQSAKISLMEATSLGKDALHVYVGLAVMLLVVIVLKKPLRDWRPLAAVLLAALAGEIWDVIDTFSHGGTPKFNANWKDVWNTMFWPTALFALARFTRVLKR
jgi:cell shape-determining protein MreD